jgi:hypothetical protein
MKTIIIAIAVFFCVPVLLRAQTDQDALKFSQVTLGGTARMMGAGGAFGALGADFGTLSYNPAGIGLYRNSEFSFSPSFTGTSITTTYIGETNDAQQNKFNISNFGLVIASDLTRKNADNKWKRLNFAFGANRTNNFNQTTYYRGFNYENSLVDYYLEELNAGSGTPPSQISSRYPFTGALVWESYLVNPDADTNYYYSVIPDGHVEQDNRIEENGSATEYLFSVGSNYDDKLFLGASIGMPSLHYSYSSSYVESDVNNEIPNFNNFQLIDNRSSDGVGFNGKFGLSYRVNEWVRFGGAFHTPTYYYLHDQYNSYINAVLDTSQSASYSTPYGSYNYDLITPWRALASVAVFIKQYGFISVDYEFVDYGAMHYNFKKYVTSDELAFESNLNTAIDQKYGPASDIRIGGEFVYDIFRFRAGYDIYGSPFKKGVAEEGNDYSRRNITGGIGIKTDNFSVDAAYVHTTSNEWYQPYTLTTESVPGVDIKRNTGNFVLSFAYRF